MISANELRIGNWVKDIHASDIGMWQVNSIRDSICHYGGFRSKYKDLLPIPLTPELLEKCGFEYKDMMFGGPSSVMQYWRNDFFIVERGGELVLFNDKEQMIKVELKSLHQLQNLYHALTGEELTINLSGK